MQIKRNRVHGVLNIKLTLERKIKILELFFMDILRRTVIGTGLVNIGTWKRQKISLVIDLIS